MDNKKINKVKKTDTKLEFKTRVTKINPSSDVGNLQTENLSGLYVSDALGDIWKKWTRERAVIIQCQTGSGKSYFIMQTIVNNTIKKRKRVTCLFNRSCLSVAAKKELLKLFGIPNKFTDEYLLKEYSFDYVDIMTYQQFYCMLDKYDVTDVEYLIMDEIHFFMDDATFSGITGKLLDTIPGIFQNSIRVYISATADESTPYIVKAETTKLNTLVYRVHHMTGNPTFPANNYYDSEQRNQIIKEALYAPYTPTPIIYKMPEDYSYINLKFFEEFKKIEDLIVNSGSEKWIIFVSSKKFGIELHEKYPDSLYIDADTKKTDTDKIIQLVEKETFDEKMLICTTVFINGNNIKDKKAKNIVIFQDTISDIKQALGRIRVDDKKSCTINVYLKVPEISDLGKMIGRNKLTINEYYSSLENPWLLADMAVNSPEWNYTRKIAYPEKGKLKLNKLAAEKLINNNLHYGNLISLLEKGTENYCKFIAKIFNLRFKKGMCEHLTDKRAEIIKYLDELVDGPILSKDEYVKASEKITDLRQKYGFIIRKGRSRENFGVNRKPLDTKAMNSRLKHFKFNYFVEKLPDDQYQFVKC